MASQNYPLPTQMPLVQKYCLAFLSPCPPETQFKKSWCQCQSEPKPHWEGEQFKFKIIVESPFLPCVYDVFSADSRKDTRLSALTFLKLLECCKNVNICGQPKVNKPWIEEGCWELTTNYIYKCLGMWDRTSHLRYYHSVWNSLNWDFCCHTKTV